MAGLILAGAVAIGQAQTYTNIIITAFDTSSDPFVNWVQWWGGDVWTVAWDGSQNASDPLVPPVAGSGAMKFNVDWTDTSGVSGNQGPQFCWLAGFGGGGWNVSFNGYPTSAVNGFYYDLDFDLMFDPGSARSANDGSFGNIQVGFAMPGYSQYWAWTGNGYTNQGWNHIHAYVDPTVPNVWQLGGVTVYLPWQTSTGNTNAFYTNASQVTTFWIDNIVMKTNLTKPMNPPTLGLAPVAPIPGLNIQTTSAAGTYDRDCIATVNSYSWVGAGATPVTYAIKIAKYPGTNYPNCQTHIFLASGASSQPGTEASPDWNEPNCVFLQVQNNADGSASGRLMWKTNDANANDQLWGSGTLGTLNDPAGVLGTWSLTFVNDTNVTLTTPSGLTTNWIMGDENAMQNYFPQGNVIAYFGFQPNAAGNVGQGAVYSEVKISGLTPPIDDKFSTGVLDLNTWVVRAAQPAGVTVATSDVHWNVNWTLPDLNFQLQGAPSVMGPWADMSIATNAIQNGAIKTLAIPDAYLPGPNASYFRMIKRTPTQLQVLLPGESNAPGTATGKTGTPLAQAAGVPFDITINACDATWNIAPCSDTVHLTTTDPSGYPPNDTALVNGTVTITGTMTLFSSGSWTITASDASTPSIAAGTSSAVTIP